MQKEKDITKSRVELMKNELASRIGARCEATEHRFLLSLRCRLDVSPLSHSGGKKKAHHKIAKTAILPFSVKNNNNNNKKIK